MNKTEDIEWAIGRILLDGPQTLEAMEARLPSAIRSVDRRWIGVAVYRMLGDGQIRAVGCASDHNHDGTCVAEAVR